LKLHLPVAAQGVGKQAADTILGSMHLQLQNLALIMWLIDGGTEGKCCN